MVELKSVKVIHLLMTTRRALRQLHRLSARGIRTPAHGPRKLKVLGRLVWLEAGRVRTRFGEGGGQLDRWRARGGLNPCARESKARTRRFLREKLISDHGHFSSYEGHMERRTGNIRGAFSRMHRALDGWMLARTPASPAQGLHHHGPRYFYFPYFGTMCSLEKLGIVYQNGWNVLVRFVAENAGGG